MLNKLTDRAVYRILVVRCYASAVYAVALCLSVCVCQKLVFYKNV